MGVIAVPPRPASADRPSGSSGRQAQAFLPRRHPALPAVVDRPEQGRGVTAVDPDAPARGSARRARCCRARPRRGTRRSSRRRAPRPAATVSGGAGRRRRATARSRRRCGSPRAESMPSRPKASICRDARFGVGGVDADAQGLHDRVVVAAPQPFVVDEAREPRSAYAARPVADRAVVAEQRRRGVVHHLHQLGIRPDLVDGLAAIGSAQPARSTSASRIVSSISSCWSMPRRPPV